MFVAVFVAVWVSVCVCGCVGGLCGWVCGFVVVWLCGWLCECGIIFFNNENNTLISGNHGQTIKAFVFNYKIVKFIVIAIFILSIEFHCFRDCAFIDSILNSFQIILLIRFLYTFHSMSFNPFETNFLLSFDYWF